MRDDLTGSPPDDVVETTPRERIRTGLKKSQIEKLRNVLLLKRGVLVGDLDRMQLEALRSTGKDISVDNMADSGSDSWDQHFSLQIMENEGETLRAIHDALARIEKGTYGACEECRAPIPLARLEAIPYARFCVECQRKLETR
ncbi:MAG: TraR/DksA C4-type zinc finger protein [Planctomycetota bacterium]